jgi:hypothetical protein
MARKKKESILMPPVVSPEIAAAAKAVASVRGFKGPLDADDVAQKLALHKFQNPDDRRSARVIAAELTEKDRVRGKKRPVSMDAPIPGSSSGKTYGEGLAAREEAGPIRMDLVRRAANLILKLPEPDRINLAADGVSKAYSKKKRRKSPARRALVNELSSVFRVSAEDVRKELLSRTLLVRRRRDDAWVNTIGSTRERKSARDASQLAAKNAINQRVRTRKVKAKNHIAASKDDLLDILKP